MIGLLLFKISVGILLFVFLFQTIRYFRKRKKMKESNIVVLDWFKAVFWSKFSMLFLSLSLVIFILCSVVPYLLNARDSALVQAYSNQAWSIEEYLGEYIPRAEANRMDPVLIAQRASDLRDKIIDNQLEVYKARARIESRNMNRWYFWLNS